MDGMAYAMDFNDLSAFWVWHRFQRGLSVS